MFNEFSCLENRRCAAIRFWNTRPLVYGIESYFEFLTPAEIGTGFRKNEWDVALVPVAELLGRREVIVVDGVSISAWGAVQSVFLAHRVPLQKIRQIAIDPTSRTSVALLKVLIEKFGILGNQRPRFDFVSNEARLLIGDQALSFREQAGEEWNFLDLAAVWTECTHLPMTFAVWILGNGEVPWHESTARVLRRTKEQGLANLERIVDSGKNAGFLLKYFQEFLRFELDEEEKKGVRLFLDLAKGNEMVMPSLRYI